MRQEMSGHPWNQPTTGHVAPRGRVQRAKGKITVHLDQAEPSSSSVRFERTITTLDATERWPLAARSGATTAIEPPLSVVHALAPVPSEAPLADHHVLKRVAKRTIDIVGALALLLVTAPLWIVAAIAIKLDSPGRVFFKQTRVGHGGRPFTICKFRTMQNDADAQKVLYLDLNEADGPYFKLQSDPRVTRVGRILRRFSIDELPQVLNVLLGTMSLVGPRPALPSEVCDYPHWVRRRLAVRPGLTGLWQVSGRFLLSFPQGANLDVAYVDEWSLALDLRILARTPRVVLSGHGAS